MKYASLLIIASLIAMSAMAQVPTTINFQGNLTEPGTTTPIADGDYALHFALFDVSTGGTNAWSESHPAITVINGLFNVKLGSVTPLPDIFGDTLWLEITVGGEILTPRVEFASTPYSMASKSIYGEANFIPSLGHAHIGGDLDVGGTSPTIDLAIDDDDTGLDVAIDGELSFYANGNQKMFLNEGSLDILNASFNLDNTNGQFSLHPTFGEGPNQSTLVGTVSGHSMYPQIRFLNDTSSGFVDIGLINGNKFVIEDDFDSPMMSIAPDSITFSINGSEKFFIANNGTLYTGIPVGIGVGTKLELNYDDVGSGFGGMWITNSATAASPYYGYVNGSANAYTYLDGGDGNKWKLFNSSGVRMTVTPAGNVGIGNQSPPERLSVSGNIASTGSVTATGYNYSSPKTQYYSISATAFTHLNYGDDQYFSGSIFGTRMYENGASTGTAYVFASVNLPQGATVTRVDVWMVDNVAGFTSRFDLVANQLGTTDLYTVLASGSTSTDLTTVQTLTDTTITSPVIDNSVNSYVLAIQMKSGSGTASTLSSARITYTVPGL